LKIKRKSLKIQQVMELFIQSEENFQQTFSSWKDLLLKYLEQRFGKEREKYEEILRDLKII
jgi:hypothetical protein